MCKVAEKPSASACGFTPSVTPTGSNDQPSAKATMTFNAMPFLDQPSGHAINHPQKTR
jgi:hypothetical protein